MIQQIFPIFYAQAPNTGPYRFLMGTQTNTGQYFCRFLSPIKSGNDIIGGAITLPEGTVNPGIVIANKMPYIKIIRPDNPTVDPNKGKLVPGSFFGIRLFGMLIAK